MLLLLLWSILVISYTNGADYSKLLPKFVEDSEYNRHHENLTFCVEKILTDYYKNEIKLTYINLSGHNDDFLDDIHSLLSISVAVRTLTKPLGRRNLSYLIMVENENVFSEVVHLNREMFWNPYAKFLVVIYNLHREHLRDIFSILLQLRVINVVVVNGTETTELYTYNPFENYGCGKYFSRIIEYGKCRDVPSATNIYPEKVVTGLEKCNFKVSVAHWPPFSIDPNKTEPGLKKYGVEQEMLEMIGRLEKFTCNYTFDFDPQFFSLVSKNASIDGPLVKLQTNESDIMLGGIFLTPSRSKVFSYLHGHLDYTDEVKIVVRRSETISPWLDIYLDFSTAVWALLITMLALYSLILIMLTRTNDKVRVAMVLLDNLLSHGSKLNSRPIVKIVFIIWVWFAYLVNCFYTSALVSRTTRPGHEFQINDEESLVEHNLKPCLWRTMQKFVNTENIGAIQYETSTECYTLFKSLSTVSRSKNRFTIAPNLNFKYNKMQYFNKYGESPFYVIDTPVTKLIYAIYFYNGFPASPRFHTKSLTIKETGLINKVLQDIYYSRALKYRFQSKEFVSRFTVPWRIYVIGVSVSLIALLIEIASKSEKKSIGNHKEY